MANEARKVRDPRAERLRARGVIRDAPPAPAIGPEAIRRATASRNAGSVGAGLRLAVSEEVRRRKGESFGAPVNVTVGLLSMVVFGGGGFLVGGFVALVVASAIGIASGMLICTMVARSRSLERASQEFDTAEAFDALASKCIGLLPTEAHSALAELKRRLMPLLSDLAIARSGGGLSDDDAFFVHELVRRYLPDALEPYLAIREHRIEADKVLVDQLTLLSQRLSDIARARDVAHEGQLVRNKNFLERKLDQQ